MNKKYLSIIIFILVIINSDDLIFSKFYTNPITVENTDNLCLLVNKKYRLSNNYIPKNLSKINIKYAYDNKYLVDEARVAFEHLSEDAKKDGFYIIAISAYRDYDYQNNLYNSYVNDKGRIYADKCSARPGHSEHQTGLSVDVMGSNNDYNLFEESKEFNWMKDNSYKYGFIMRYPKNKEYITGFKYEPWHYRYVGIKSAKVIYDNNLTLEEYDKLN